MITLCGVGYLPVASATWASAGVTLAYALFRLALLRAGVATAVIDALVVTAVAMACVASVRWGPWAIERFGRKDPKPFVLDEFAGQSLALLALPPAVDASGAGLAAVLVGQFLLFRLFDILKPSPARELERLPRGWGILCDDLMAGIYANVVGQLAWRATPLGTWLGSAAT